MIFLVAFLGKDKKFILENGEMGPYLASKIFNQGLDFENQETVRPNFVISSIFVLNEVLMKIRCYDDHRAYGDNIYGKPKMFYKSNPVVIKGMIKEEENFQPIGGIDFHCKSGQPVPRVSLLDNQQAEEIDVKERISMLEKFKNESPPVRVGDKFQYPNPDFEPSEESEEDEDMEFRPYNIMRNSRAERTEKFEENVRTPRAPDVDQSHILTKTLTKHGRNKSSAAKLRTMQRKNSVMKKGETHRTSTDDSGKEVNLSFKNEL